MNYQPQQYGYYPTGYEPQFWQVLIGGIIDVVMLIALGAWALSLVRKAIKGEEVDLK
ncbi:MAG: cytosine permease [Dehalococcoidales bacterium]|nr:cytosine permease [Dehalococcoidales bacterium]